MADMPDRADQKPPRRLYYSAARPSSRSARGARSCHHRPLLTLGNRLDEPAPGSATRCRSLGAVPSPISVASPGRTALRSRLLAELVSELAARAARLFRRDAGRHSFRPRARLNPTFRGVAFPVFELLRPIPPLAWVPGLDHLLADAGAVDRFRHLPRRLLHHRAQCRRRRATRSTCA